MHVDNTSFCGVMPDRESKRNKNCSRTFSEIAMQRAGQMLNISGSWSFVMPSSYFYALTPPDVLYTVYRKTQCLVLFAILYSMPVKSTSY